MSKPITFSNPRFNAEFNDWPSGRDRVECSFHVEHHPNKGYRVRRATTKHGVWCKPKTDTYNGKAVIVDGSDGKTYILQQAGDLIYVKRHDFMNVESYYRGSDPIDYAQLAGIIDSVEYHEVA